MKTVFTSILALVAAASTPALADTTEGATFSYNPNQSVSEVYVDLAETAEKVCAAAFKNSAIGSVWGTAIKTCERELLDDVIGQIGNPQLASLHEGGAVLSGQSLAERDETN